LLIAKSALLSGTPLELMRMKISETVSTSRSSARPMIPICVFWIRPRWARFASNAFASTSGFRSRYSRANERGDSELKYSLDVRNPLLVLGDHRGQSRELFGDRVERDGDPDGLVLLVDHLEAGHCGTESGDPLLPVDVCQKLRDGGLRH